MMTFFKLFSEAKALSIIRVFASEWNVLENYYFFSDNKLKTETPENILIFHLNTAV